MSAMVRLGLSPRAAGLTRCDVQAHWRGVHASLFARVPGVRSYVQHHAVLDARGMPLLGDPGFDIFSEVEFENEEAMAAAMASAWYREQVVPDEQRLLDASRRCFLVTRRHVAAGRRGSFTDCKLIVFVSGAAMAPADGDVIYEVQSVGGAAPRHVETVLARNCASVQEAMNAHRKWIGELQKKGARIEAAVVVRENEVVPRGLERKSS